MKKVKVETRFENGDCKKNKKLIKFAIKNFDSQDIILTFSKVSRQRSVNQNSYYWGVVVDLWREIILEEWQEDYDRAEMHEFLKMTCNYEYKMIENTGEEIKKSKSTAILTTIEFEEYCKRCRDKAYEYFNAIIPLPNEQLKLDLENE